MALKRFNLYLNKVFKLVETIVIKSEETINGLNQYIIDYYGKDNFNELDPLTWKYYLNVSGQYHFSDTEMSVVSWDTLETIVFNIENLNIHRATFRAYSYGTIQYKELVKKYPKQELLILGILNPVDINTAINAKFNTVLAYDSSLVEENEYNLINKINTWLLSFHSRWNNKQYGVSDELYAASLHAVMFQQLVPAILNFRLESCKTNEAHSYHITEYLLSHGLPEVSINHMTKKQMLFFYRNIKYIRKNAGHKDTFNWLLEHIMTNRFLPISEFVMKHDETDQLTELYPAIKFKNNKLNNIYGSSEIDFISLKTLLIKEVDDAIGNKQYTEYYLNDIDSLFKQSKSNTEITKVLESSIINYQESGDYSIEDVLLNHWLYFSVTGIYVAYYGIENPKTNERIPLSSKDAFILMIYSFAKSVGIDLFKIPKVVAKKVIRMPLPTVTDIMSVADHNRINDSLARTILSYCPEITSIKSTEAFNSIVTKIHDGLLVHRKLPSLEEHEYNRGLVNGMCLRVYCDKLCTLDETDTNYEQWFIDRKLDFTDYTREEFEKLYLGIVAQMTGTDLVEEPNLMSLQNAMIKLFQTLSSYSIQFVKQINSSGMINLNTPMIRLGDIDGLAGSEIYVYDTTVDFTSDDAFVSGRIIVDTSIVGTDGLLSSIDLYSFDLNSKINIGLVPNVINVAHDLESAPVEIESFEITPN